MYLIRCLFCIAVMLMPVLAWSAPVVSINGVNQQQRDNITAWLGSLPEDCAISPMQQRALLRRARQDARKALEAIGYYQAAIDINLKHDNDCWQLLVDITPGEPVRISRVDLEINGAAASDPAFIALQDDMPVKQGDILRHDQYEALKNHLLRLLSERGYIESSLSRQVLWVDAATLEAGIELHVDSGPRYRFGHVSFQQDSLDESLLEKFVVFSKGEPFDNQSLLALRQSLSGSGYFADVRVTAAEPDKQKRIIPVTVTASARKPHVYTAGIGFATDTGPRLRLGFENRRANRRGHRYHTELTLSPVRSSLGLGYDVPMGNPARERINFSTGYIHENLDDHKSERYHLGTAYIRELESGWVSTTSINYEREDFTVGRQTDRTDLIMPGYALDRTRADNRVYPRNGWHVNASVRFADEMLASSVSFIQFHTKAKWIWPLFTGRVLMRMEGGATIADKLTDLPSSVRFFAGGDNSVRGYAYESLGPVDDKGDVTGGRHLLVGSIEYDIPILENWSVAVFTDAGNAFDTWDGFDPVSGEGAGIRWHSPIGPVRLDLAHPDAGPDNYRLHISMGMDL